MKEFARSKMGDGKSSLMSRLREIQIEAPDDFAINHDLYINGEKHE